MNFIKVKYKNLFNYRNTLLKNFIIILSFFVLSLISIYSIWHNDKLFFIQEDSFFHLGRVEELIRSNHIFPIYSLNSFNFVGSAVNIMYPYILLYPMVIIYRTTKSIKYMILIYYIIMSFIALIIAFFSSLKFSKNHLSSYIFAIIYTFSGSFMSMYFYSKVSDIGVYLSAIFLPLILFGFIYYLNDGKWIMFSLGMSLVLFSNIISVIFLSFFLMVLLLLNYKHITLRKIFNLFKAILLTCLTTACLWLPIMKLDILNKLDIPSSNSIGLIGIKSTIFVALKNNFALGCQSISVFSLIGGILGFIFFKKFSLYLKQIYILAICIFLFCSKLFPWNLVSKIIILRHIQTTMRMLVVPQLILEFVLAICIAHLLLNSKNIIKYFSLFIIIFIVMLCQLRTQQIYICKSNQLTTNSSKVANNIGQIFNENNWFVYSTNVHKIIYTSLHMGNTDYWPASAQPIHHKIFNESMGQATHKYLHFYPKGNGNFYFENKFNKHVLQLPFLYYYGTNYQCYLNGKPVKFYPNKYQLMTINNVKKGNNHVLIKVNLDKTLIVSRGLSIVSIPIYIFIILKKRKRITNNMNHLEERNHA